MFLAGLTSVALWDPEPLCSLKANGAVNRESPESASVFVCYTAQARISMSLTSCLHSWRGLEHKNTLGITHVLLWSAPQAPYGYSQHTGVGKTTTGHSLPPSLLQWGPYRQNRRKLTEPLGSRYFERERFASTPRNNRLNCSLAQGTNQFFVKKPFFFIKKKSLIYKVLNALISYKSEGLRPLRIFAESACSLEQYGLMNNSLWFVTVFMTQF